MECNNLDRRAAFVLGSHRSGTSVLARALITSGVYFGESFIRPGPDNPKGFFEDRITCQLNDNFLATIQCRWNSLCLPSDISKSVITTYQSKLKEDVLARFANNRLWGMKDPRICRLWKHWLPVLTDAGIEPIVVLANRHPFSVADSLAKRDQLPQAHALALWAVHQLDALEMLLQHQAIVVDYDLMLDEPRHQLLKIANFLGETDRLNEKEIEIFESDFLSEDLRHARYKHESAVGPLQMFCLELHAEIMRLALLPGGIQSVHRNGLSNLLSKYRAELAKSFEWMHAIDDLQSDPLNALGAYIAPVQCETQMFWRAAWSEQYDGYGEERANTQCYAVDGHRHLIQLTFSAETGLVTRIRLDIVNALGVVDIHDLYLLDPSGAVIWKWSGDLALMQRRVQLVLLPGLTHEVHCTAVSLGNDPWVELDFPEEIYARIQPGCTLTIELTPYRLLDRLPFLVQRLSQLAFSTQPDTAGVSSQIGTVPPGWINFVRNLETLKELLHSALTQRDEMIVQQSQQLRGLREELIRAKAQRDFLTDVLLDRTCRDRLRIGYSHPI